MHHFSFTHAGQIGEQGKPGPQGSQGSRGARGDRGDRGSRGPKGDIGEKGERGNDGNMGRTGGKGSKGKHHFQKLFIHGFCKLCHHPFSPPPTFGIFEIIACHMYVVYMARRMELLYWF